MELSAATVGIHSSDWILDWPKIHVPNSCKGVDIVVGIDEAGRGPVLGSLIYCAAFWPVSENEEICKMGFDDSKQLKEDQRNKFLQEILTHPSIGYVIREISAQEIAEQMLKATPKSLNSLSYDAVIEMLETIRDISPNPPRVEHVYVDTVGDPTFYRNKLMEALGPHFADEITVEKKADATFKVVGAASIIAKQTRDTLLERYRCVNGIELDKDFGSGYPSDERCVQWLIRSQNKIFGYPVDFVRFSWSTARVSLKEQGAAMVEWPCDEEESMGGDISSFFGGVTKKKRRRSEYYRVRKMKNLTVTQLYCS